MTTAPEPSDLYPCQVGVFCDVCGTNDVRDYLVSDDDGQKARFEYARATLRHEGWTCDATGDLCPACVRDIAASVNALGPGCPGCALVESACRRQGGRCCDLCQHRGEGK